MSKHTQGPWHIGCEQDYSVDRYAKKAEWARVRGPNNGLVARIESVNPTGKRQSCDFDIESANARLIAACPDMYEALRVITDYFEAIHMVTDDGKNLLEESRETYPNEWKVIDQARAAIAKAEQG